MRMRRLAAVGGLLALLAPALVASAPSASADNVCTVPFPQPYVQAGPLAVSAFAGTPTLDGWGFYVCLYYQTTGQWQSPGVGLNIYYGLTGNGPGATAVVGDCGNIITSGCIYHLNTTGARAGSPDTSSGATANGTVVWANGSCFGACEGQTTGATVAQGDLLNPVQWGTGAPSICLVFDGPNCAYPGVWVALFRGDASNPTITLHSPTGSSFPIDLGRCVGVLMPAPCPLI